MRYLFKVFRRPFSTPFDVRALLISALFPANSLSVIVSAWCSHPLRQDKLDSLSCTPLFFFITRSITDTLAYVLIDPVVFSFLPFFCPHCCGNFSPGVALAHKAQASVFLYFR